MLLFISQYYWVKEPKWSWSHSKDFHLYLHEYQEHLYGITGRGGQSDSNERCSVFTRIYSMKQPHRGRKSMNNTVIKMAHMKSFTVWVCKAILHMIVFLGVGKFYATTWSNFLEYLRLSQMWQPGPGSSLFKITGQHSNLFSFCSILITVLITK